MKEHINENTSSTLQQMGYEPTDLLLNFGIFLLLLLLVIVLIILVYLLKKLLDRISLCKKVLLVI